MAQRRLETNQQRTGSVRWDGNKQYLELTAAPLSNRILILDQDMTNMRRFEKIRQDFIANIYHELRTPISSCKAIVETIQNGTINDKNIAEDFLQRMHVETGKLAQADRAQLGIHLDIPPDLSLVEVYTNRIEQVLVNLVHNAIKFTPQNGNITISSGAQDDMVWTSIHDTSVGIPADDLPHIFERFYKVDKARSSGDNGQGLAIAKHIVQAHGGDIWVESEDGKGSTFIFFLPSAGS